MATQLAVSITPPRFSGEVLPPAETPLLQYHAELQSAAKIYRSGIAKIAYFGFRMRLSEGWVVFGFEPGTRGEDAYRESLDIPRSTYYKAVRIGQALHQLSFADLERISTTNAELLMQVNPAIMHDHPWISEAKVLKPKAFAELVAERNKTVGDKDPLATIALKVPFLAKQAIENMLESFQHRHELSSKGQALELMIADLQYDASLLSAVEQARKLLAGVAQSMKNRRTADEDEQTWVMMAKELLDESYEKAVQAARKKQVRGEKDGGRP
jgi:hypothetical protein